MPCRAVAGYHRHAPAVAPLLGASASPRLLGCCSTPPFLLLQQAPTAPRRVSVAARMAAVGLPRRKGPLQGSRCMHAAHACTAMELPPWQAPAAPRRAGLRRAAAQCLGHDRVPRRALGHRLDLGRSMCPRCRIAAPCRAAAMCCWRLCSGVAMPPAYHALGAGHVASAPTPRAGPWPPQRRHSSMLFKLLPPSRCPPCHCSMPPATYQRRLLPALQQASAAPAWATTRAAAGAHMHVAAGGHSRVVAAPLLILSLSLKFAQKYMHAKNSWMNGLLE